MWGKACSLSLCLAVSVSPSPVQAEPQLAPTETGPVLVVPPPPPPLGAGLPFMPVPVPVGSVPPPVVVMPPPPTAPIHPVLVHLNADDLNATLSVYRRTELQPRWGRHGQYLKRVQIWSSLCRMPCDVVVDADSVYAIDGLGIRDSENFQLPTVGPVTLNVRAGHPGTRVGGILLTSLGSMPLVVGLVLAPIGLARMNYPEGPGLAIAGGITLGVGLSLVIGGIYMLVVGKTRVWTSDGYRLAALRGPQLAENGLVVRF